MRGDHALIDWDVKGLSIWGHKSAHLRAQFDVYRPAAAGMYSLGENVVNRGQKRGKGEKRDWIFSRKDKRQDFHKRLKHCPAAQVHVCGLDVFA